MKLLRYGPKGQEKPAMLDAAGVIRDLSGVVPDIAGDVLSDAGLAKLKNQQNAGSGYHCADRNDESNRFHVDFFKNVCQRIGHVFKLGVIDHSCNDQSGHYIDHCT